MNASWGAIANPNEKPTIINPKLGARHFGGITSDKVDNATPIHDTNPDIAPTL